MTFIHMPGRWMTTVERAPNGGWQAVYTDDNGTHIHYTRWRWQASREAARMQRAVR